jgi:hypothetical protein
MLPAAASGGTSRLCTARHARSGDPELFLELEIPRSTAVSWIRRGVGEIVSLVPAARRIVPATLERVDMKETSLSREAGRHDFACYEGRPIALPPLCTHRGPRLPRILSVEPFSRRPRQANSNSTGSRARADPAGRAEQHRRPIPYAREW